MIVSSIFYFFFLESWLFFGDGGGEDFNGSNRGGIFAGGTLLYRRGGDSIHYFYTFYDLAEDDIVFGKLVVLVHDEELAAVGVRAGIGHSNGAARVFTFKGFVFKLIPWSAGAVTFGVAALNHEAFDGTVKNSVIVESFSSKNDKIVDGNGGLVGRKSDFDFAFFGVDDGGVGFSGVDFESGRWFGG